MGSSGSKAKKSDGGKRKSTAGGSGSRRGKKGAPEKNHTGKNGRSGLGPPPIPGGDDLVSVGSVKSFESHSTSASSISMSSEDARRVVGQYGFGEYSTDEPKATKSKIPTLTKMYKKNTVEMYGRDPGVSTGPVKDHGGSEGSVSVDVGKLVSDMGSVHSISSSSTDGSMGSRQAPGKMKSSSMASVDSRDSRGSRESRESRDPGDRRKRRSAKRPDKTISMQTALGRRGSTDTTRTDTSNISKASQDTKTSTNFSVGSMPTWDDDISEMGSVRSNRSGESTLSKWENNASVKSLKGYRIGGNLKDNKTIRINESPEVDPR